MYTYIVDRYIYRERMYVNIYNMYLDTYKALIIALKVKKKNSTNLVRPTFYSYFKESFSGEYHKRDNNKSPLLEGVRFPTMEPLM